jgi:Domain of Unknown Function (DUF1080)
LTLRTRCLLIAVLLALPVAARPAPQGRAPEWRQLFNGKDLTGWEQVGLGSMTVEDGLIKTHGGMGLLWWTGEKFGNCVIRVVYKTEHKADNSGVFIRIPIKPRDAIMPVNYGYEVSIEYDPSRWHEDDYFATGALYSFNKIPERADHPGPAWNQMEITLDGSRTIVVVNGVKVTDYTEGAPIPPRKLGEGPEAGPRPDFGYIGLQNETDKDIVYFKEIAVRPLQGKASVVRH